MTNYENIKNIPVDEIAKIIYENEKLSETICTDICNKQGCHYECVQQEPNCLDCFKQWLNSECEKENSEMLFKAKRQNTKVGENGYDECNDEWISEWVEGYYGFGQIPGQIEKEPVIIDKNNSFERVIEKTVCEYTGRKDKNSQRIFENDYVIVISDKYLVGEEDGYGTVVWDKDNALWGVKILNLMIPFCHLKNTDLEVVGNIFDNCNKGEII